MVFMFLFLNYFTQVESTSSIHVAANDNIFFCVAEQYFLMYVYHIFLIQSSISGHLSCFPVLVFVNIAAMNMQVHVII